jgi:deoxyinosine 3'endonuclease (endonuclease V)
MVGDRWFPRQAPDPQRRTIQRAIAAAAQWDRTAHRIATGDPAALHVCGVDAALEDAHLVAAAVCVRDGQVCERAIARRPLRFPYIPGMLAFREGAAMAAAVGAIDGPIDCLIVDGNGRIHPRQAGTAVHLGVASGLPTIGVAKRLLCGHHSCSHCRWGSRMRWCRCDSPGSGSSSCSRCGTDDGHARQCAMTRRAGRPSTGPPSSGTR